MYNYRREILFFYLIRPVFKADISKAEKGESAFICVLLAVAGEFYLCAGGAVVGVIEIAVAVERLAVEIVACAPGVPFILNST